MKCVFFSIKKGGSKPSKLHAHLTMWGKHAALAQESSTWLLCTSDIPQAPPQALLFWKLLQPVARVSSVAKPGDHPAS